ncbi:MAG: DUF1129 domain-containing protein [Streptococcaceae bacterium]|jgi:uncharacterized membrane-anchored protein|nr:DUF1129 domain-containing protein [Streptococcaceae bacterium]
MSKKSTVSSPIEEKPVVTLADLTGKNADYVHSIAKQLMVAGKSDNEVKAILADILPRIVNAQKNGVPARQLLGTPTEFVSGYAPTKNTRTADSRPKNKNPWLMGLDNFLLVFSFLGLITGIQQLFSPSAAIAYGLVTMILSAAIGAFGLYYMYAVYYSKFKENEPRPRWSLLSILSMVGILVVWFFITSGSMFYLPRLVNPTLNAPAVLILSSLTFGGRYLLRHQFNVQPSMITRAETIRHDQENKK